MEVSREQLTRRLQELSSEELLRHRWSGVLTPLALEVTTEILRSRGQELLAPAAIAGPRQSSAPPVHPAAASDADDEVILVTVAGSLDPLTANVLRACLESHGVFVHLWGEHLAVVDPILSWAGGRIRLQVRMDQLAWAREVLSAFEKGELEIADPDTSPPGEMPGPSSPGFLLTLIGMIIALGRVGALMGN